MAQARKFGAFAGVFTPSILTILGVIMYLRLPSIVGQAGLLQTLGIIAVAHIISVATGLSVSSIATDKKVKAGGTYYIISRSLGLPVGGTLGLALFVGLSFSVSMYLVGFSESFLSYWGLPVDIGTIRLAGTIALVAVTTVTLISTALALKTQFYIMGAIALSLLSIVFGRHEFAPSAPLLHPIAEAAPFIVLFGIFFPAVTGFEAGVSMSGDLKDPKRSIPAGTISAIVIGLVVYMALAIFFAFTVSSEQLVGNANVLLDIALFPPLVIAGIWGATISSAFGSILSAPRILQATANDGITPGWFGVGYGRENEPRHALVPAFLIAEAGILIGELNVIARVVSMFFITTYGFLNLTAAIESWVSPDFRPEFRVPKVVAVVGAIACFVVMIQLDFLAMLGASVILGGLYAALTRRQLRLETGDTWEGVWSSLARASLLRLHAGLAHRRNWRPNVLLFSGGPTARPHLVEFGRHLAGSRGLVTAFDLVEGDASTQPTGPEADDVPLLPGPSTPWGVFTRRVHCPDVLTGVAEITHHYGFAGIEPNTVVMGWPRTSAEPQRVAALLQHLAARDLNILLLDYDHDRGWGKRQRIDVWWRLTGSDVSFSLALIRFLTNSDEWRDASIRFLTVNDHDRAYSASILRDMVQVLEEHRVHADVRVIDNVAEGRAFPEIIRGESIDADLTVLGISDLRGGDPGRFFDNTNSIVDVLGTVVLTHASSYFGEPLVRTAALLAAPPEPRRSAGPSVALPETLPEIEVHGPESIAAIARVVGRGLQADVRAAHEEFVHRIFEEDRAWLTDLGELAIGALMDFSQMGEAAGEPPAPDPGRSRRALVRRALERIAEERERGVPMRGALLTGFGDRLALVAADRRSHAPEFLDVVPDPGETGPESPSSGGIFRRRPGHRASAQLLLEARLRAFASQSYAALLKTVSASVTRTSALTQRWMESALSAYTASEADSGSEESPRDRAFSQAEVLRSELEEALRESAFDEEIFLQSLEAQAAAVALGFARDANDPGTRRKVREALDWDDAAQSQAAAVDLSIDTLPDALGLLLNGFEIGLRLGVTRDRILGESGPIRAALMRGIVEPTVRRLEALERVVGGVRGTLDEGAAREVNEAVHYHLALDPQSFLAGPRDRLAALATDLPESIEVMVGDSDTALAEGRTGEVEADEVPVREVFDYLVRTEVLGPLLDEILRILQTTEAAAEVCREVAQLAAFELRAPEESARATPQEAGAELIVQTGTERLRREVKRLAEVEASFDDAVRRRFESLAARFDPFSFHRVAARLQQYVRTERSRGLIGGFTRLSRRTGRALSEQVTALAYRRSEGVLLARRLERDAREGRGPGVSIRRLVKEVSPRPEVLEKLPTFYRQLFLGGATVARDVPGFEAELAEASGAVEAHRRGAEGALFIAADQGHGRATLSTLVAQRNFPRDAVFRLDPVEGGSADPHLFERRLAHALRAKPDTAAQMIARLPVGCALLINDLGLWWDRSREGGRVLDLLDDLVARLGKHCLFIINVNIHAFRLMNRMRPVDDRMLGLIECEPFHARELKDLVLLRHGAGGLGFSIDGRLEESLSEWRLARFFDALFAYSNGNTGAALNTWIASIREVEDDIVHLVTPRRPGLDAFAELDPIQRMIGLQLVIHDQATLDRLARITRLDRAVLARELRVLQNSRFLLQKPGGAVYLDRFVRPHFVRFLTQEALL